MCTGLWMCCKKLVDAGNTVVVIEHNLDVIKVADYILDLGPEGGDGGGRLVASGTPEEVAQCEKIVYRPLSRTCSRENKSRNAGEK